MSDAPGCGWDGEHYAAEWMQAEIDRLEEWLAFFTKIVIERGNLEEVNAARAYLGKKPLSKAYWARVDAARQGG